MIINFVEHCSIQVNGTRTVYLLRKPSMWDVGGSSTMFTCENWVHLWKKYCPPLSVFMCEEHELCTKLLLQVNGRRTVSLVKKKKHECKKHEGLRHCFPVRLHLASERNTAYLSGISNVRSITFVWNSSIQVNGSNTVSPVRKSSTLEAGGSSTLFSCEKWGGLLKEYLRFESILKWKNHSLYVKYLLQVKWRNTSILWQNTMCSIEARVCCILFENWITYWKEYCLPLSLFMCEEHHCSPK
jgi:hypothetical protein